MTKTPTTTRWALIRPDGTERAAVEATTKARAATKLRAIIRKAAIPKGWKIVATGGPLPGQNLQNTLDNIKAALSHAPAPTGYIPTTTPRPFKVGDRVKVTKDHWLVKEGTCEAGRIFRLDEPRGNGEFWSNQSLPGYKAGVCFAQSLRDGTAIRVEPAPQPKTEEFKPGDPVQMVKGCKVPVGTRGIILGPVDENGGFRCRWNGGHGILWAHAAQLEHVPQNAGPDYQSQVAAMEVEIQSLNAELEHAKRTGEEACRERDLAKLHLEEAEAWGPQVVEGLQAKLKAAEGKLDDIKAIYRVADLIPDWDTMQMDQAIAEVLAR